MEVIFDIFNFIYIKKNNIFKKGTFKQSIQTLYLSKIGPNDIIKITVVWLALMLWVLWSKQCCEDKHISFWWQLCYMSKRTSGHKLVLPSWYLVGIAADDNFINPIQHGPFLSCSWMGGGGKKPYPTMMKLGTVIPYLRKTQKIYESCDTPLELCWYQHFSSEISKFCYIRKYKYRLYFAP